MAFPTGSLLTTGPNQFFLIVNNQKQQFPDSVTLAALTIGLAAQVQVTVTPAVVAAIPAGPAIVSVQAFHDANPRIVSLITRAVRAFIPSTGLKNLAGGLATIVTAAAGMYANAEENPAAWATPVNTAKPGNTLPAVVQKLITDTFNKLLNDALKQFGGTPSADGDNSDVDDAVDDTTNAFDGDGTKNDKDNKEGEKEDVKEAGDKEDGEKEAGEKDDKDDKEDKEGKDDKDGKEGKEDKEGKDDKDGKEDKEGKDDKDGKEGKEDKEGKDDKDEPEDGGDGGDGGEDDAAVRIDRVKKVGPVGSGVKHGPEKKALDDKTRESEWKKFSV